MKVFLVSYIGTEAVVVGYDTPDEAKEAVAKSLEGMNSPHLAGLVRATGKVHEITRPAVIFREVDEEG